MDRIPDIWYRDEVIIAILAVPLACIIAYIILYLINSLYYVVYVFYWIKGVEETTYLAIIIYTIKYAVRKYGTPKKHIED